MKYSYIVWKDDKGTILNKGEISADSRTKALEKVKKIHGVFNGYTVKKTKGFPENLVSASKKIVRVSKTNIISQNRKRVVFVSNKKKFVGKVKNSRGVRSFVWVRDIKPFKPFKQ